MTGVKGQMRFYCCTTKDKCDFLTLNIGFSIKNLKNFKVFDELENSIIIKYEEMRLDDEQRVARSFLWMGFEYVTN